MQSSIIQDCDYGHKANSVLYHTSRPKTSDPTVVANVYHLDQVAGESARACGIAVFFSSITDTIIIIPDNNTISSTNRILDPFTLATHFPHKHLLLF